MKTSPLKERAALLFCKSLPKLATMPPAVSIHKDCLSTVLAPIFNSREPSKLIDPLLPPALASVPDILIVSETILDSWGIELISTVIFSLVPA